MRIVVLTGGLGAGKSTAAEFFRERGAVVICLDTVARELMAPGSALLNKVGEEFGPAVVAADGSLDREALARVAFASPDLSARLNAIVHPAVAAEVGPAIDDLRLLPHPPEVVVLEVPLLAEAPVFAELADEVVAIEAPVELRVARAVSRGLTEEQARARVAAQAPDSARAELATATVVNAGTEPEFRKALEGLWSERIAAPGLA